MDMYILERKKLRVGLVRVSLHGHKRGVAKGFIAWTYMWKKVVLGVGWCLTSEVPPYICPDVTILVDWALKTSSLYPLYSFLQRRKKSLW